MRHLPPNMIRTELQKINGWELIDGKITKTFRFTNFPTAVLFVNKLVNPAEEMDHHPSVTINYDRVTITLMTHQTGGVTTKDIDLAKRIDEIK